MLCFLGWVIIADDVIDDILSSTVQKCPAGMKVKTLDEQGRVDVIISNRHQVMLGLKKRII